VNSLGSTRSTLKPYHLLHTPDTFIRIPLPGADGVEFIVHASPQLGAGFTQMTAEFSACALLGPPPAGVQRFLYVLDGALTLIPADREPQTLTPGMFAYIPADTAHQFRSESLARAALIEKPSSDLAATAKPQILVGNEAEIASSPLGDDPDLLVRHLMPDGDPWDFAVNTMTYAPGAALAMVEVHVMEHGLLMLAGGGIYRLGDHWYPVTQGDFIWMAPYCPQWFGALGKTPAKYLIYKDWRRHPLGA